MQVFKLCMKIIRKNSASMSIYIIIFLAVSIMMSSNISSETESQKGFIRAKSNIAFISEESSALIDSFRRELGKTVNFVELPDETEALQDALYFRSVFYILRVPRGFTDSFMNGEEAQLVKTVVPDSISNTYIDLTIDKYFNTARLYVKQMEGITQEELIGYLETDMAKGASVTLQTKDSEPDDQIYANYYFNYMAYSLLSILILGMTALILVYNDPDLKRRNACSPLNINSANMQFILANLLFTFAAWLFMIILCFIFNYKNSQNLNTVYFIINSFVFAVSGAGLSFLIGNLVKGRGAIAAVNNVVTLGSCFISGVFVPQSMLGGAVLRMASLTPAYWFVKANDRIAQLTQFDFSHVRGILSEVLMQAGFALLFFTMAMLIARKKRFS